LVSYFFLPVTSVLPLDEEVDVNSYWMTFRKREDKLRGSARLPSVKTGGGGDVMDLL
jgi:hypothetical protein